MTSYLTTIWKALAGAVASTATSLGTAMADGDLTRAELIVALGAGLIVGGGLVYAAPKNTEPEPPAPF